MFENKPLIGMLHLGGQAPVQRALEELKIYENEGLDGVIVEDYFGSEQDVVSAMESISERDSNMLIGVNLLRDYQSSFQLVKRFNGDFIQIDSVQANHLDLDKYAMCRETYPEIPVLGGVRFKYREESPNSLEFDVEDAKNRCEVIVTTGEGTGIETPIEKLKEFKILAGDYSVFVGAGVNINNAYEQVEVADGAIVGSYLKFNGMAENIVEPKRVRDLVKVVEALRS